MHARVLALDIAGNPFAWLDHDEAVYYYAAGKVAWDIGEASIVFRGGVSNRGVRSVITARPIIAIAGSENMARMLRERLPLGSSNELLFRRDRQICAYCGEFFQKQFLTRDHVLARSRGGPDRWENCVTACGPCNFKKGAKDVSGFKPLLYVPYAPCRFEHFILSGRNIVADQMEYLSAKLPAHSRLRLS